MLARLVEQRDAIILVLTASPYGVENLTSDQWTTAVQLLSTLEPLINITQLMTLSSYPPLSLVIPALVQLRQALISMSDGVEALRDVLRRLVDEHFGDVFEDDDLCAATVLGNLICYYSANHRDTLLTLVRRVFLPSVPSFLSLFPFSFPSSPMPFSHLLLPSHLSPLPHLSIWCFPFPSLPHPNRLSAFLTSVSFFRRFIV